MVRDDEIEQIAVRLAIEHEKARGWDVESVESENRGFDLISRRPHPEDPKTFVEVRFIEVKGRAGVGVVALSQNEYRTAERIKNDYWLYVAFNCGAGVPPALSSVVDCGAGVPPAAAVDCGASVPPASSEHCGAGVPPASSVLGGAGVPPAVGNPVSTPQLHTVQNPARLGWQPVMSVEHYQVGPNVVIGAGSD